jgi:hypothetical protein
MSSLDPGIVLAALAVYDGLDDLLDQDGLENLTNHSVLL